MFRLGAGSEVIYAGREGKLKPDAESNSRRNRGRSSVGMERTRSEVGSPPDLACQYYGRTIALQEAAGESRRASEDGTGGIHQLAE